MGRIKLGKQQVKSFLKKHRIFIISIFHSFFLLILGYIWLGMTYTFGDEAFLIKWTSIIKKEILTIDPKPSPNEVLFINTSQSKVEIEYNDDPLLINPKKIEITDRKQLAELIKLIEPFKNQVKLVVLDILFDLPSDEDSLLQIRFDRMGDKIIGVSHMPDKETLLKPVLNLPFSLATYRSAAGMFFKYPVVYDGHKTVPAVIYEKLSKKEIIKKGLFFRINNSISLKAPITDFKVRMNDFKLGDNLHESNYAIHHLGTLTEIGPVMDQSDLSQLFAGKLILIGDFDNDLHKTAFGMMPGLLIIFNAYLTLKSKENIVNIEWLLLMIIGFTWISYRILTGKGFNLLHLLKNRFKSGWIHFILDSLDELFFLSILTVLSYLFFNIHINILVLFVYLKLVEFIFDILKNKYNFKL